MRFKAELIHGHLVKRYQRFLADVKLFSPRREIDPSYAQALGEAVNRGGEILVSQAKVGPEGIDFHRMLPVVFL